MPANFDLFFPPVARLFPQHISAVEIPAFLEIQKLVWLVQFFFVLPF
jgi:hypothetical protein